MGFLRSIGRIASSAFRSISSGGGLGGLLKTGLSALTGGGGGLGGLLGGLLEKGVSKLTGKLNGFLGKLGPFASMAQGALGMIGGLLGQMGQKGGMLGKIAEFAQGLIGKLGGAANIPAPGLNNLTELFAKGHAQSLLQSFMR